MANKKTKSAKNKKTDIFIRAFASAMIVIGYTCMVLPTALDVYSRIGQTTTISSYESAVDDMSEKEIEEAFQKATEYNEKIYQQQQKEPYVYTQNVEVDEDYLSLPLENNDEICSIVISKINVNVPVGHGTSDDLLQREAGHLYGTSLPIGGANTHAVIAAHSALQSSELFTRLGELEEGDYIDIKVLNETHRYVVDQITVCLPEDANQYLQIEEGKDLITLYTCTPYGINSHRLLVRASRIEDPVEEQTDTDGVLPVIADAVSDSTKEVLELVGIIALPIALIIVFNVIYSKSGKPKRRKCQSKISHDVV